MKTIYKSPRFWLIVATAILQSLVVFKVIDGVQSEQLTNIISTALVGIVAVRTVDKLGEKK